MDHIRIDEGIKRQQRKRTSPTTPIHPKPMLIGKLAEADLDSILHRYLSDESTAQIAASLNVHRSALHQWLLRHAEEPWKQAQIARAITALEQSKDDLASAPDALSLARAREQLRGAQWELERLFSRVYGPKQELSVSHTIPGDVISEIRALSEELGLARTQHIAAPQLPEIEVVSEQQGDLPQDNMG